MCIHLVRIVYHCLVWCVRVRVSSRVFMVLSEAFVLLVCTPESKPL